MKTWLILLSLLPLLGLGAIDHGMHQKENDLKTLLASFGRDVALERDNQWKRSLNDAAPRTTWVRRATATSTRFSQALITWAAASRSCNAAAQSVNVSCAIGGIISLLDKRGVSTCTKVSTNTYKCIKLATADTGSVAVKCTGTFKVTAALPSLTLTNCKNSIRGNAAYQLINLEQVCAMIKANVKNYTVVGSKVCTPASGLNVESGSGIPLCTSRSYTCTNTSKTTCSMKIGAVTVSSPSPFSSLCILP